MWLERSLNKEIYAKKENINMDELFLFIKEALMLFKASKLNVDCDYWKHSSRRCAVNRNNWGYNLSDAKKFSNLALKSNK